MSTCHTVCLPVCLLVWMSACLSTCLPACLSVRLSISLIGRRSICLPVQPSDCLSVHPFRRPLVRLSIRQFLSASPSICLSMFQSIYLYFRLPFNISLPVSMRPCHKRSAKATLCRKTREQCYDVSNVSPSSKSNVMKDFCSKRQYVVILFLGKY